MLSCAFRISVACDRLRSDLLDPLGSASGVVLWARGMRETEVSLVQGRSLLGGAGGDRNVVLPGGMPIYDTVAEGLEVRRSCLVDRGCGDRLIFQG